MTQDEIIRMAVKCQLLTTSNRDGLYAQALEAFAELVAEKERESCAKLFDEAIPLMPFAQNDQGGCLMCGFTPKLAAQTIRARSNP
jgi:ATP-dependent helicase/DNAse subunit B